MFQTESVGGWAACNKCGELIDAGRWAELTDSGVTDKGERIITNTIYYNGNPVVQNISVRDDQGKVRTTTVFRSKILP